MTSLYAVPNGTVDNSNSNYYLNLVPNGTSHCKLHPTWALYACEFPLGKDRALSVVHYIFFFCGLGVGDVGSFVDLADLFYGCGRSSKMNGFSWGR